MKTLSLLVLLLLSFNLSANPKTKVLNGFHMSLYENSFGKVSEFEIFTKLENKEVYMGLSCLDMSLFPTLQLILKNKEILATLSKNYIPIDYEIINENKAIKNLISLEASLKVSYKDDKFSNRIRLQVHTGKIKDLSEMQSLYKKLLDHLKTGTKIKFYLQKNELEEVQYIFSLQGLKSLLFPHETLCR